jgi:DnaJ family protein C protein 28
MTGRLSSLLASPKPLISGRYSHNFPGTCAENHQCASAKLFADAEQEEAEARNSTGKPSISQIPQLQSQDENWTGDESIRDAVLRMLVDKYKPMRGPLRTAETKLREAPPKVYTEAYRIDSVERSAQTWQEIANKPLLPSVEGHKPWHTTYKVPSHTSASIKFGNLAPASESAPGVVDKGTKKTERVLAKRKEHWITAWA